MTSNMTASLTDTQIVSSARSEEAAVAVYYFAIFAAAFATAVLLLHLTAPSARHTAQVRPPLASVPGPSLTFTAESGSEPYAVFNSHGSSPILSRLNSSALAAVATAHRPSLFSCNSTSPSTYSAPTQTFVVSSCTTSASMARSSISGMSIDSNSTQLDAELSRVYRQASKHEVDMAALMLQEFNYDAKRLVLEELRASTH